MKLWQNILLLLFALPLARADLGAGRFTVTLTNGGFERVPHVQVPTNYTAVCPIPVVFRAMYLEGQGHTWPGGRMRLLSRLLPPGASSIKATDVIWEFFKEHPRK